MRQKAVVAAIALALALSLPAVGSLRPPPMPRALALSLPAMAPIHAQPAAATADDMHGGRGLHDKDTASPIRHVIVIIGENRSFDHVFATYVPRSGQHVANLLSRGIINADGTPGRNHEASAQRAATDTRRYAISPARTFAYV